MYLSLCSTSYDFVFHKDFRITSVIQHRYTFFDSKITTFRFERQHNQARFDRAQRSLPSHFLYGFTKLNIEQHPATKEGNSVGSMGSKSKIDLMKSYKTNKKEVVHKLKKTKQENAQDIISKSMTKPF